MEPVTSILLERGREPQGLRKMLWASLALHVLAGVALVASPLIFHNGASGEDDLKTVMTITLPGGPPGPMTGGANPMGGRPVQTTEPAKKPEAIRPPAAKTPEMTMPAPKSKVTPKAPTKTESGLEEGRGKTLARGKELSQGSAFGDTGVQGSGFGLSTGGLGGTGSYLDVSDFCCPDYLVTVIQRIQSNWNSRAGARGDVLVKFTIAKDGTLNDITVERPSNIYALDSGAERAVVRTAKLPPLPAAFSGDHLTIHLKFEYTQ